jgi:hypothetical protein
MATRKQHVVPYFYLKEFFPGFIYRRGEQSPRFTKKPSNISVRKDYYGKPKDNLIFQLDKFNSVVESETAPIIKRLINNEITTITHRDWIILSYFFANMQIRNPSYHKSLRNTFRQFTNQINEMVERIKESYEKAKAEGKEFHIPERSKFRNKKGYSLEEVNKTMEEMETKNGHIKIAQDLYFHIKDIASYIQKMSLHVIEAAGGLFFVTTDTPLILYSLSSGTPVGAGWANQDAMAMIPIHPKKCLVLAYREEPAIYSNTITSEDILLWNINLMKYASHEIYSKHSYDIALDWMLRRGMWSNMK